MALFFTSAGPGSLARRDRVLLLAGLGLVTVVGWIYLVDMAAQMADTPLLAMRQTPWTPAYFAMMLIMWVVMMIAMMVPTAMRTILVFAAIARRYDRGQSGSTSVAAQGAWFTLGYVIVWSFFCLWATLLQWQLDKLSLLSPDMAFYSPHLGAMTVLLAGIWQLSPLKNSCLKHCRHPTLFLSRMYRSGPGGAIVLGLAHGAYCLGCCWVLMGLLFVGGVMNLLWILLITLFVLAEKLLPTGLRLARITGWTMVIGAAGFLLAQI